MIAGTMGRVAVMVALSWPGTALAGTCAPAAGAGEDVVITAVDADNRLRLADGRLVQLAGLDTASLRLPRLAGREATLLADSAPDRHGAVRGGLVVDGDDLAALLLRTGAARVRPRPDETFCYAELIGLEAAARRKSLGLWSEPEYAVADAAAPEAVSRFENRFVIVAGRVLHIGEARGSIWIDFGRVWRSDVTVVIPKRVWPRFEAAGITGERIKGRNIRARGVVTMRHGPRLDITEPAAIELIDTEGPVP